MSTGLEIFGGLEENNEEPLKVLSLEPRLISIGLLNVSAKWTPRTFSSGFVSGAE
jgi:hypothetical protein